jgi:parallel beta-helix repeat protein
MTSMHARAAIAALTIVAALAGAGSAAAQGPVKCGDIVTRSVKLTADLTDCLEDGLVVGAAGITIDLDGHTIDGTVTQTSTCDVEPSGRFGITDSGYDGLTVKDGTLQQFAGGFNAGSDTAGMAHSSVHDLTVRDNRFAGISLGSGQRLVNDNRIVDNRVSGNGCAAGIGLTNGDGNLIARNRVHDNGSGVVICCSDHNVVRNNVVSHSADVGILVCCDGSENSVARNAVLDNDANGILVLGGQGTLVRENRVARNGNDIVIFDGSGNTVARNLVFGAVGCSNCGGLPTGFGIGITMGANDTTVFGNLVSRSQADGIGIIDFDPSDPANPLPNRTTVRGNVVRAAGRAGVRVDAGTEGTVLERNRVFRAAQDGIRIDSAAAVLTGNRAFSNHDLGIEAVPGVTDGGGNRAHGNGNPAQCAGVACG